MGAEEPRVREERPVARVRKDGELCVRDVLRQIHELTVGTMMSFRPFTTSVGRVICRNSVNRSPRAVFRSARSARCARTLSGPDSASASASARGDAPRTRVRPFGRRGRCAYRVLWTLSGDARFASQATGGGGAQAHRTVASTSLKASVELGCV